MFFKFSRCLIINNSKFEEAIEVAQTSERLLKSTLSEQCLAQATLTEQKLEAEAELFQMKMALTEAKASLSTTVVKLQDAILARSQQQLDQASLLDELESAKNEICVRDQKLLEATAAKDALSAKLSSISNQVGELESSKTTVCYYVFLF